MRSRRYVGAALAAVMLAVWAIAAGPPAIPALAYPPEQLARGETVWNETCAECHGPGSTNADAPLLLKPVSLKTFANAAAVFEYAREKMPDNNPGTLADQQYWDVIAFVLSQQGIQPDAELGPATAGDVPTTP